MSPAFEKAIKRLFELEGGYSNHPSDRGGETKYGISRRAYPDLDIAGLTLEEAKQIYFRDYWLRLRLDAVLVSDVAGEIFEQGVHFGVKGATENAQRAMNYLGAKLEVDGLMGPKTLRAINGYLDTEILLKVLNGVQFARYLDEAEKHPEQKIFARGWLRRIEL